MMYPPRQAARKDPWKTTIHGSPLQPSRFMNHSRQQKLLQMKREEEMNHHSVKVQNMTAKRTEGKPDPRLEAVEASSPGENTVSPTPPPEQATDPDHREHAEKKNLQAGKAKTEPPPVTETLGGTDGGTLLHHRKTTKELTEEFKDLNWADVDEYNSFKAKLEEQALSQERVRRQNWLRGELEAQLKEQRHQKEVQKREEIECARELRKELDLWKAQEQEKQKNALEKMLHQKEVLDAQMQERQKLEEEYKAEQLRESQEILEQVSRHMELEKRRAIKAKQQKARAMQEILEVTAAERRLAEARAKQEQEEDMRLLKLSVQLEKEAAERARQERQMLLDLHQSRADKIAMLATIDKKELATLNALKRDAEDQARRDILEREAAERKKAEQMKVHEYLKIQQQEKARQRDAERQERYELQRLQEIDAQEYKKKQEMEQRSRRELCKRQQELLVKQMEERKLNKDILVSQTEMKLNRQLLEEVNDYLLHRSPPSQEVQSITSLY